MPHPLNPICQLWLQKIRLSKKHRWERFGQYAAEAKKFFDGSVNFMWQEEEARGAAGYLAKDSGAYMPKFRMQYNKLAECVALYGPALYYQNPSVLVSLNEMPEYSPESLGISQEDMMGMSWYGQQMAQLAMGKSVKTTHSSIFQSYSNRIQYKTDKKTHARRGIVEAIVSGMSFLWTEMYTPRGGGLRYPRSVYVSSEDIGFDMDADYEEDIQWCFRECVHPVNLVERKYGLPEGSIKGNLQSLESQADEDVNVRDRNRKKRDGRSFDLIRYYEVYSKNGFGDKLKSKNKSDLDFSAFGDYCYIVVAPGVPFPLNMPSWDVIGETAKPLEELAQQAAWPIPFWQDEVVSNGWPFSRLHFMDKPKSIYPVSMVKPVIGQMRFLNWIMSFLADKTASSCVTYLAQARQAGVEIQNQLQSGMAPFQVIEIADYMGKSINDVVSFLQSPQFSIDIWKMAAEVASSIDKALGTIDLLYGQTEQQMRSAREADVKQTNLQIRPDDMANRVEEWVSTSCLKEMEAARWLLTGEDIATVLDPIAAQIWDTQILTQDVDAVVRDFTFRIEAGSARKPNKQGRIKQLQEMGAAIGPVVQQFALNGNPGPWNALMAETGKAMDFDASPFLVQPPPPQQGPSPEEMQLQMEQQKMEHDMQLDGMKAQLDAQSKMLGMQVDSQAATIDMAAKRQEMMLQKQQAEQDLKQDKELTDLQAKLLKAKAVAAKRKPAAAGAR